MFAQRIKQHAIDQELNQKFTGEKRPGVPWRHFKKARAYVRGLQLKSQEEWLAYCKSDNKPADIPAKPEVAYANTGWDRYGDWLGTGNVATHLRQYRSFKMARAFVRRLGLKSHADWRAYCRSGKKPADIPAAANITYAKVGWSGMDDWLGTGSRRHRLPISPVVS